MAKKRQMLNERLKFVTFEKCRRKNIEYPEIFHLNKSWGQIRTGFALVEVRILASVIGIAFVVWISYGNRFCEIYR